jgi:uroporphyrinogen decarboxylase
MGMAGLRRDFGELISFHGGISVQQTMPLGQPRDVQQAVAAVAAAVKPESRYIFCTSHNIQADTPVANVLALLEAYELYGGY